MTPFPIREEDDDADEMNGPRPVPVAAPGEADLRMLVRILVDEVVERSRGEGRQSVDPQTDALDRLAKAHAAELKGVHKAARKKGDHYRRHLEESHKRYLPGIRGLATAYRDWQFQHGTINREVRETEQALTADLMSSVRAVSAQRAAGFLNGTVAVEAEFRRVEELAEVTAQAERDRIANAVMFELEQGSLDADHQRRLDLAEQQNGHELAMGQQAIKGQMMKMLVLEAAVGGAGRVDSLSQNIGELAALTEKHNLSKTQQEGVLPVFNEIVRSSGEEQQQVRAMLVEMALEEPAPSASHRRRFRLDEERERSATDWDTDDDRKEGDHGDHRR